MFPKSKQSYSTGFFFVLLFLLLLSGCANFGTAKSSDSQDGYAADTSQPYYPPDFREVLIPDGLEMNRENSMYVKTSSFNGGILSFDGRIDVISLSDFFENSMPKKGWKLVGVVKAKNYLLIFTKPDKTCMITISENKLNFKTVVNVYIALDAQSAGGSGSSGMNDESFSVSPLQ